MVQLPIGCSADDVLRVVCQWVELLAQEKYEEAFNLTFHDSPSNGSWTPKLIETLVANYGFPEPRSDGIIYRVSALDDMPVKEGDYPYQEVFLFEKNKHNLVGHIDFTLPLNGEWSDVTATFDILEVDGAWVLWLEDMHVQ